MIDHSGFRIHYTNKLRANEGGILISGISVSDTLMIPPNQNFYRNVGICGPSCTKHVRFNEFFYFNLKFKKNLFTVISRRRNKNNICIITFTYRWT